MRRFIFLVACTTAWLAFGQAAVARADSDLSMTKTGPDTVAAGANVTYTLQATNLGPDAASSVEVRDPLPAGTTFVSLVQDGGPTATCTTPTAGSGGTVTCSVSDLPSAGELEFSLTVNVDSSTAPGTFITNTASVTALSFDPNDENNSSTSTASTPPPPTADVSVSKSGPDFAAPDSDFSYELTVTNAGPDTADSVALSDTLPGTLTFVDLTQEPGPTLTCTTPAAGNPGTVSCSRSSLAAGATARLRLTVHVPDGTSNGTEFTNTLRGSTATFDPNDENNQASDTTTVSQVDVSAAKSGPASAVAGTNVTYQLSISNSGPGIADATLSDTLPANTTFVSLTQNNGPTFGTSTPAVGAAGTVAASGALAPGETATFTLVVRLDAAVPGGTNVANTATASSVQPDTDPNDDSSTATTAVTAAPVDLSVSKTAPAQAVQGSTISYTVGVANAGPGPAGSITLTDPLPAATRFVSATQTAGPPLTLGTPPAGGSGDVTATGGLAAGQSASFTIQVSVVSDATVGSTITNTASATTSSDDLDSANDSASASSTVAAPPAAPPTSPPGGSAGPSGPSQPTPPAILPDRVAPVFTKALGMLRRYFRVGAGATPRVARTPTPVGTAFLFSLSEPAAVTIVIARVLPGRRVGRSCRVPTRANRNRPRCTRYVVAGTLRRLSRAGANRIAFTGRIGLTKLVPGFYRATARATDAAGNTSKPSTATFTVAAR